MTLQNSIKLLNLKRCPACGEQRRKRIAALSTTNVFECDKCDLRYLDPCLSPESMETTYKSEETLSELHSFHEGYYDYGSLTKKSQTLSNFKKALVILESYLPGKNLSILDVGAGNGFFLAIAKEHGWKVSGIDSSERNIELANQKFGINLSRANFSEYKKAGRKFDVISFWDVIEHFSDPNSVIKEAENMLNPKGFFLIGLPNDRSFLRMISMLLNQITFGLSGLDKVYFLEHIAYYNLKSLKKLMASNGFILKNYFYTSTDLNKYTFTKKEKFLAAVVLFFGKITRLENRLIAVFSK